MFRDDEGVLLGGQYRNMIRTERSKARGRKKYETVALKSWTPDEIAERLTHLLGVLQGHCDDVGRDNAEITKTTMRVIIAGRTNDEAQAKLQKLLDAIEGMTP